MSLQKDERRRHKRWDLTCPVTVVDAKGQVLFKSQAVNASDGGAYVTLAIDGLAKGAAPKKVGIRLSVPRTTPNSFMFEEFQSDASIIRTEPLCDADRAGIAMQFAEPLKLDLGA